MTSFGAPRRETDSCSILEALSSAVAMVFRLRCFGRLLRCLRLRLHFLLAWDEVDLGHYRVRNVDADVSGPRVADDYGRRAAEMQRSDIDAGIERGADHRLVRLNGCAAQPAIRQSDDQRPTL